jgi:hypothetical protein
LPKGVQKVQKHAKIPRCTGATANDNPRDDRNDTTADPHLSIRDAARIAQVSPETARKIRHKEKFQYYASCPVPPLKPAAKAKRVAFCEQELKREDGRRIIFTDESMIAQNMNKGGVWRRKGIPVSGSFYEKEQHPISVMVWGAIGHGYRGPLIRCNGHINGESYQAMLTNHRVLDELCRKFRRDWFWWQQDNAPAHRPSLRQLLRSYLVVNWPARSPDLSPIEMMWAIVKRRLRGRRFRNADELFAAIKAEWEAIPQATIDNLCSSFKARCQVCKNLGGECLNGHWKEVHRLHHSVDPDNTPEEVEFLDEEDLGEPVPWDDSDEGDDEREED